MISWKTLKNWRLNPKYIRKKKAKAHLKKLNRSMVAQDFNARIYCCNECVTNKPQQIIWTLKMTIGRQWPTLYKFAKSGAIQEWSISTGQNPDGTAFHKVLYGQQNGAQQTARVDVVEGKNIGKRNETTPYEQACAEAQSKWERQLDKGYAQGAPKPLPKTQPMLAKPYEKEMAKVIFPCHWQPKLDGVRCIAARDGDEITLLSRKGKVFEALDHIKNVLKNIMEDGDVFDGELYCHNVKFQTLISWIKRKQSDTAKVIYNVYDVINEEPFSKRFELFCQRIAHKGQGIVKTVYTGLVDSHSSIRRTLDEQLERGYEGIMLRIGDCKYQVGRRSSQLLKVKVFVDEEYPIVGAEENKGRQKGQCTFVCETKDGARFKVKPMGTDEQRRNYWKRHKELIGKQLTVRYFELTSSEKPVPRFPIGIAVRDYE